MESKYEFKLTVHRRVHFQDIGSTSKEYVFRLKIL
jgi:hypothetical protein